MKHISYICDLCKNAIVTSKKVSTSIGDFHESCIFERMTQIIRSRSVEDAFGIFRAGLKCTEEELVFAKPSSLKTLSQMMDHLMETAQEMRTAREERLAREAEEQK